MPFHRRAQGTSAPGADRTPHPARHHEADRSHEANFITGVQRPVDGGSLVDIGR